MLASLARYVPPHKRTEDDSDGQEWDADDEQATRNAPIPNHGKLLSIDDIHRVNQDFHAASYGDQKLNLPEFKGESNSDTLMDWIIYDSTLSQSLNTRRPRTQESAAD